MYTVYTLDSNASIDWKNIVYRTAEELNENEFGQDIDGDGNISTGSVSSSDDTYADYVSTSTTDAETLSQIQDTAQSDIYSIKNADAGFVIMEPEDNPPMSGSNTICVTTVLLEKNIIKHDVNNIIPLPVIPNPTSLRDAYAFRQHVETCRKNRGASIIPEFDQFPVFYFSNHISVLLLDQFLLQQEMEVKMQKLMLSRRKRKLLKLNLN